MYNTFILLTRIRLFYKVVCFLQQVEMEGSTFFLTGVFIYFFYFGTVLDIVFICLLLFYIVYESYVYSRKSLQGQNEQ